MFSHQDYYADRQTKNQFAQFLNQKMQLMLVKFNRW